MARAASPAGPLFWLTGGCAASFHHGPHWASLAFGVVPVVAALDARWLGVCILRSGSNGPPAGRNRDSRSVVGRRASVQSRPRARRRVHRSHHVRRRSSPGTGDVGGRMHTTRPVSPSHGRGLRSHKRSRASHRRLTDQATSGSTRQDRADATPSDLHLCNETPRAGGSCTPLQGGGRGFEPRSARSKKAPQTLAIRSLWAGWHDLGHRLPQAAVKP